MGATVYIAGIGNRIVAMEVEEFVGVYGADGFEYYSRNEILRDTRDEEMRVQDFIGWGLYFLAAIALIAFFGIENLDNGLAIVAEYARIAWAGLLQIVSAVLFHDAIPGPIAEDDTIHVVIFTVRDWLGLGNN